MEDKVEEIIQKQLHNKVNNSNIIKSGICIMLSFLLSIALVGFGALSVIQWSCFNRNTIYSNLASSNYYQNIQTDIYAKAKTITLPTGLSPEVLDNTTELNKVQQDVNGYIEAGFRKEAYAADTALLKNKLEDNVVQYLKTVGIAPDQEQKGSIAYYVEAVSEEYKKAIRIPLLNVLVSARDSYNKIYPLGIAACIAFAVITTGMLIRMNERLHHTLRYVAYSTITAAFMIAIAPAAALYSGFYKRIQLSPQYYYKFAMIFITNIFHTFLLCSLCFATVSIAIIVTIRSRKLKLTG